MWSFPAHLIQNVIFDSTLPSEYLQTLYASPNGSYFHVRALKAGTTQILSTLVKIKVSVPPAWFASTPMKTCHIVLYLRGDAPFVLYCRREMKHSDILWCGHLGDHNRGGYIWEGTVSLRIIGFCLSHSYVTVHVLAALYT